MYRVSWSAYTQHRPCVYIHLSISSTEHIFTSVKMICYAFTTSSPRFVFWYHNDRMVNYDSEHGVTVRTTKGKKTHSKLSIHNAKVSDSGNYTCSPSSSVPASIQVFVSAGE